MEADVRDNSVDLWLNDVDTFDWANRSGASWPCSALSGKFVYASFDRNGLVDLRIDGMQDDCPADELNALTSDFLEKLLPENHPCYYVTVGQFKQEN
ncbi:MAG: hypothetical protein M1378_11930 [Bacteroidetes bacterium]|nr:hypothetical protein [Bacteroidota bacterium]